MKKIFVGLAFFGAMAFTGTSVNAQGSVEPVEGAKYVCCQTWKISTCTDRFGWPYNGTEKVNAEFCP